MYAMYDPQLTTNGAKVKQGVYTGGTKDAELKSFLYYMLRLPIH